MDDQPKEFAGTVTITWPRPRMSPQPRPGVLPGWGIAITDPQTGQPIHTVTGITVHLHASAESLVWAELTMFADADGKPVFDGTPHVRDGEMLTGTFPFLVQAMEVAPCTHPGREAAGGQCGTCGEWYGATSCPRCGSHRELLLQPEGSPRPARGAPLRRWLCCLSGHREDAGTTEATSEHARTASFAGMLHHTDYHLSEDRTLVTIDRGERDVFSELPPDVAGSVRDLAAAAGPAAGTLLKTTAGATTWGPASRSQRPYMTATLHPTPGWAGQGFEDICKLGVTQALQQADEAGFCLGVDLEVWSLPVVQFTVDFLVTPAGQDAP